MSTVNHSDSQKKAQVKLARLKKWMPRKRWLPLLAASKCPLKYNQRRLYSFLVFRSKNGEGATVRRTASRLGYSHHTITKAISDLIDLGLAEKRHGKIFGLEPKGEQAKWFAWKKGEGEWHARLATYREYFPTADCPLTESANAVLWWLHSFCQEGLTAKLKHQKLKGIALNLGVNEHTVSRAMKSLEQYHLVRRWGQCEIVLAQPQDEQLCWWLDCPSRVQTEKVKVYRIEDVNVPDAVRADAQRVNRSIAEWTERMLEAGMPADDVFTFWKKDVIGVGPTLNDLMTLFYYTRMFEDAFNDAEAQHKETGRFVPHSLNLLKNLMPAVISHARKWAC